MRWWLTKLINKSAKIKSLGRLKGMHLKSVQHLCFTHIPAHLQRRCKAAQCIVVQNPGKIALPPPIHSTSSKKWRNILSVRRNCAIIWREKRNSSLPNIGKHLFLRYGAKIKMETYAVSVRVFSKDKRNRRKKVVWCSFQNRFCLSWCYLYVVHIFGL